MKVEHIKGLIEVLNGDARNAMHSILGFLELISEGELDPAQREYVAACRVATDRHFRGIEDVRIILGLVPDEKPVITHFSPGDLFARVTEAIDIVAAQKGVGLFCNIDNGVPPVVSADLDRIGHALVRIAEAVVSTIGAGDVYLNFQVPSSPIGTSLDFEIFAPARTLSPILMRALQYDDFEFYASMPGSGALGLAAARNLITSLSGRVDASADPITGTRIVATLPVAAPMGSVAVPQPGVEPSTDAQRALRILVAEDSEDSFRLFKAYLQGQPHSVARATNGVEAVELAVTGDFDLVFMDICMPIVDGYTATRQIREWETGKDRARMPIVVLSAEDLRAQRRQGALVGCSGHLTKPLRKQELLEAIKIYSMPQSSMPLVNFRSEPLKIQERHL